MWILLSILIIIGATEIHGKPQQVKPGCRYDGKRYQESSFVNTSEPCLHCYCYEGSLRCRLRVCPRIPNPLPSGCTTRIPHENACCAELICDDYHNKELSRMSYAESNVDNGCVWDGIHYAPGSAMMGSRRCEYCYCISGLRRCVRPKCLLPLPGCIPMYAPYSCCPVAYNCTNSMKNSMSVSANGCKIGERSYEEGEMVRDIEWKTMCDNCFCAMGGIRCVPLACAPPLQGCTPIVREGQCCPSTYNCSGSIAVKATQNFASYAFISKDYAKFRKETNFLLPNETQSLTFEGRSNRDNYEFNTTQETIDEESTVSSTEVTSSTFTYETETMDNEIPTESIDYPKSTVSTEGITQSWTSIDEVIDISSTNEFSLGSTNTTIDYRLTTDIGTSTVMDQTLVVEEDTTIVTESTQINERIQNSSVKSKFENFEEKSKFENFDEKSKFENFEEKSKFENFDEKSKFGNSDEKSKFENFNEKSKFENSNVKSKLKNSDEKLKLENVNCQSEKELIPENSYSQRIENIELTTKFDEFEPKQVFENFEINQTTEIPLIIFETTVREISEKIRDDEQQQQQQPVMGVKGAVVMPGDILVMNVTLKTNVSVGMAQGIVGGPVRPLPPDIEGIVNITDRKKGDDYEEYDYSEPTLPPSLPNVRIIPFVAADALVKDKESTSPVTAYPMGSVGVPPELRPTDVSASGTSGNFYDIVTQENRFSPPVETEGGFVPREPSYFETQYHSTDLNLEIGTGVTVVPADITNSNRKNDELISECLYEGRPYRHGELLPRSGHCIICICYYGEIACSDEKCPPVKFGCQRISEDTNCCGKIVCGPSPEESPTVVLDRIDAGSPLSDSFRDVIRTEPAPDLPSLIEDMIPYLEHRMSNPVTTPLYFDKKISMANGNFEEDVNKYDDVIITTEEPKSSMNISIAKVDEDSGEITTKKSVNETSINYDEESVFSFDSVFDLLFSGTASPEIRDSNVTVSKNTSTTEISSDTTEKIVMSTEKKFPDEEKIFFNEDKLVSLVKNASVNSELFLDGKNDSLASIIVDSNVTRLNESFNSSKNVNATSTIGGLLKLAGCNIYGRMYRVGRIIVELSTPCLECRCTDLGVQCKQLKC